MPIVPLGRRATYADLEKVREKLVAEIIDGQLITNPRRAHFHAVAAAGLRGELDGPFRRGQGGPGGWCILDDPELRFGEDVLVPDLAGWRCDRLPGEPTLPPPDLAPDWVCEVLTPSTEELDRSGKLKVYARENISHLWSIDPRACLLEVLELRDGLWTLLATHDGDLAVRAVPFEAAAIELAALWHPREG